MIWPWMSWTIPITTRMTAMTQSSVTLMCCLRSQRRTSAGHHRRAHRLHGALGERIVGWDLGQVELAVEQVAPVPGLAGVERDRVAFEGDPTELGRVGEAR